MRYGDPAPTVQVSAVPAGTALGRLVLALAANRGDTVPRRARSGGKTRRRSTRRSRTACAMKAAVAAGSTSDATWASVLAPYGLSREAISLERGVSIIGRLAPRMRRVAFIRIRRWNRAAMGGGWMAEGAATPVVKAVCRWPRSISRGVITILSRELLRVARSMQNSPSPTR